MKFGMRLRAGDDVRAIWLSAACVLACGWFYTHARYEPAIAAAREQTEAVFRQTVADDRIVRESSRLRAIERQAQRDLSRVSRESSLSGTTATLLQTLQASAVAFHASVVALQPDPAAGTAAAPAGSATPAALQSTAFTIRVQGRFRDVLAFVEDLSHHPTLINVSDTELTLAQSQRRDVAEPALDATIHAKVYRLVMSGEKEPRLASTR